MAKKIVAAEGPCIWQEQNLRIGPITLVKALPGRDLQNVTFKKLGPPSTTISLTDRNVAFENLMTPENGELGETWQS
jgi:hypothetical protein